MNWLSESDQEIEVFDLGLIGASPSEVTTSEQGRPASTLVLGVIAALCVIALVFGAVASGSEVDDLDSAASSELDTAFLAGADPAGTLPTEGTTEPERPEVTLAKERLLGKSGVASAFCNGMVKHFDDTPEQVERARRYADCLAGFEVDFRLPTTKIHHAYGVPSDTEPAVLLRCGEVLAGPDISPAAFAEFELCAAEAEALFGLG